MGSNGVAVKQLDIIEASSSNLACLVGLGCFW